MTKNKLKEEEVELLNTKLGLRALFANKKINLNRALEKVTYDMHLAGLQTQLIQLQNWVIENNKKVVILFEGRDAAGKGGAIRRITEFINPRHYKIVALGIPTEDEKNQWFFQRYVNRLPKPGEIVLFDRSWYNRAMVEPVNGFCTEKDYEIFMSQVNEFEKMIIESDIYLVKFYFSISKKEQVRRFKEMERNPLKHWKITDVDRKAQELWDKYTLYKDAMFETTDSAHAPWIIIDANDKAKARSEVMQYVLKAIPFTLSEKADIPTINPHIDIEQD
jgi:polyphosphate kinase 2